MAISLGGDIMLITIEKHMLSDDSPVYDVIYDDDFQEITFNCANFDKAFDLQNALKQVLDINVIKL
jgi:hypothetical protein